MWKRRFICWLIKQTSWTHAKRVKRLKKLRDYIQRELGTLESHWSILRTVPKYEYHTARSRPPAQRIALVMQGPVVLKDDFTRETLRIYRETFTGVELILSTWHSDDTATNSVLDDIENMGVDVVRSESPANGGPKNINYQIVSTRRGIEQARQRGAQFVLKTRADNRLLAANIANYVLGLYQAFPVAGNGTRRGRLLAMDLCTRLYLPNHPSDIFMFGHIDDMSDYWAAPLNLTEVAEPKQNTINDLLAYPLPEIYLCEHYLRTIGYPVSHTVAGWWQVLADLFLIVDRASLEFFWPKYTYYRDQRTGVDDEMRNMALCSFRDWISLYTFQGHCTVDIEQLRRDPVNAIVRAG